MKKLTTTILAASACIAAAAATPAAFPGGEQAMGEYISANMVYPSVSRDNGIEGIINLEVSIKPDGSVGTVKIVRMIDPDLEQEAVRLVRKMPAWTPATDDSGAAVESVVKITVPFELPEE